MSRRRFETLESIRERASMSQKVVSQKDQDYALYSGASLDIAHKLAVIDWVIENKLIPEKAIPLLKLYRSFLDRERKAFFASVCSEISKLGFILGLKDETIHATKP